MSAAQVMAQAVEALSKYKEKPATPANRESSNALFGKLIAVELDSIGDERIVDNLKFEFQKLLFKVILPLNESILPYTLVFIKFHLNHRYILINDNLQYDLDLISSKHWDVT